MILDQKVNLGFLPTPLQPLKNLQKKYPGYNLYIKRDDATGLAFGGNKTRKLEYLLYDAFTNHANTIITAGAQQSNHCRQTAAACAAMGLECHLLLGGAEPDQYEGNLLLSHMLGAKIHFTGENRKGEDITLLKAQLEQNGKQCYIIPYGGSNGLGALGYVNAVKELKEQLVEQDLKIDYVFFASSSGGTLAGLLMGLDLYDLSTELIPINIDKTETDGISCEEITIQIINSVKKELAFQKVFTTNDISINRDYDKAGYGVVTQNEKYALSELAINEGIILDPVYTGRAFFGMLDYLQNNKLPVGSNILFWHTGGAPATFYYSDVLK